MRLALVCVLVAACSSSDSKDKKASAIDARQTIPRPPLPKTPDMVVNDAGQAVFEVGEKSEPQTIQLVHVIPDKGPYMGGTRITIRRDAMQPWNKDSKVYFGGKAAKVVKITDMDVTVEAPAGKIGDSVDVTVIADGAKEHVVRGGYTYTDSGGFDLRDMTGP